MTEDEEDRCRLSYAEGRRIRIEAQRPYAKKAAVLFAAALGVLVVGEWSADLLAGLPMGENGVRLLGQMILEGDAGAIETLYDYTGRLIFSTFAGGGLLAFGLAFFVMGEAKGREALKKANDEKKEASRN